MVRVSLPALLLAGASALAAAPAPARAEAPAVGLPEVVVTAQRREETAQRVPIALSVLSGRELERRGVASVNSLQYQTPALEITPAFGGGEPNFRLRGVGFDDYASNNTSPVGVYVDEVAYPFPIATQGLLFDLSRVEVLRGPQGTLYGRNTTGGAISFVTNRPSATPTAGLDVEYGSYNFARVEGFASGPIGAGWTARIAGETEQGGAFQHNRDTGEALGNANRYGFRGEADGRVGRVSLKIDAYVDRDRSDGTGLYLFQPLTTLTGVIPADSSPFRTGWGGGSSDFLALSGLSGTQKPFKDNTGQGLIVNASTDIGPVRLTSITGYQQFSRREYEDWDASPANFAGAYFGTQTSVVSEELRAASGGPGPVKWVAGAYYSHERLHDAFITDFADGLGFAIDTAYAQRADTEALFGQLDAQLSSRLSVTAGARLEHEERALADFTTSTNPAIPLGGGAVLGVQGLGSSTAYTQGSGKIAVNYEVVPDARIYASISRGVKSGGFTAYNTVQSSQLHAVKPEIVWAYEVGAKTELAAHTVRLNGAGFYYDYADQQVQSAIPTFAGPIGNIVNAPRARIYGVEGELDWRPLPALDITQSIAWKRGEYIRFTGLNAVTDLYVNRNGQDEGFPKLSYEGSASYRWEVGAYRITAEGDYSYRGQLDPVLLGPDYIVRAYWLANATLTLEPQAGPWSVGFWGRNVLNQRYDLTRNFFTGDHAGNLISIAAPGAPATYGVRLGYRY